MKALSIHQPWAHAILHLGKSVENRSWRTNHRGPLLVHASVSRASYDRQAAQAWRKKYGVELPPWDGLTTGSIVGLVDVVGCVACANGATLFEESEPPNPWAEGPFCWLLDNPRPFANPIPYRGAQMLFEVPDELIPVEFI